jgi:PAS domain S-box-containing protein
MSQFGTPLEGFYDYGEVARSILIAIAASYAALDLGGRVTAARGWARVAWLTGGAIAMGIGIWAMHFKALLAFRLPVTVDYHWPTVLASLVIAVLASAIALFVATRQEMGPVQAWTGSLIMGGGIAAMHYVGMAAMRMAALTRFDPLLVALSVVLAILFSRIALMFTFDYREDFRGTTLAKVISAAGMGAAISLMHYSGMAAVSFLPAAAFPNLSATVSISQLGNNGIAIVTFLVLGTAILTSSVDRQTQVEVRRLNERLEQRVVERTRQLTAANEELRREIAERQRAQDLLRRSEDRIRLVINTIPIMVWTLQPDGAVDFVNQPWMDYTGLSLEEEIENPTRPVHPEDLPTVMEKWLADMAAGEPSEDEIRLRRADGEYRWFLVRTVPLHDEQGNVVKWYGVSIDIEDRKQAAEELRRLSGQLLRSQNEERRRIARDLHDSTGQDLVALATMLGQLSDSIPSVERKARRLLSECKALAEKCIRDVRTLSYVLHSPVLDHAGLGDAIRDYADGFTKRSGIHVELELSPRLGRMERDIELALFRVVQESLTNIQRHSGSQLAKIRIHRNADLTLEISDSGSGLSASAPGRKEDPRFEVGVGIPSMQERVNLIGGRLEIDSTSHGTTVRVTIPLGGERT